MTVATVKAMFIDQRPVKSRSVHQFIFEVDKSQANAVLQALGGLPDPANPAWVELPIAGAEAKKPATPRPSDDSPSAGGAKAPRPFTSLPLPQQAALLCKEDRAFWAFLTEELDKPCDSVLGATDAVRNICGVHSRADIKPDTLAGKKFVDLREHFLAWKLVAA